MDLSSTLLIVTQDVRFNDRTEHIDSFLTILGFYTLSCWYVSGELQTRCAYWYS